MLSPGLGLWGQSGHKATTIITEDTVPGGSLRPPATVKRVGDS